MHRTLTVFTLVACSAAVGGCEKENKPMAAPVAQERENKTVAEPVTLEVAQAAALIARGAATPVDVNGNGVRKKYGTLPSAIRFNGLTDAASQLPAKKDTKLIFYCANSRCMASHQAAKWALRAGYTDVNVMPAGIMGWTEAGRATEALKRSDS